MTEQEFFDTVEDMSKTAGLGSFFRGAAGRAANAARGAGRAMFGSKRRAAATVTGAAALGTGGAFGVRDHKRNKMLAGASLSGLPSHVPANVSSSKLFQALLRKARRRFPNVPEDTLRKLIYKVMREHGKA
jgi:hypothetical protein